jgi:hypothetical protein
MKALSQPYSTSSAPLRARGPIRCKCLAYIFSIDSLPRGRNIGRVGRQNAFGHAHLGCGLGRPEWGSGGWERLAAVRL